MSKLEQRTSKGRRRCEEFNRRNPVGTRVRYYPVADESCCVETETRSAAWVLASGHPVVQVQGVSGCVSLDHVRVMDAAGKADRLHLLF
jgi:hypothetical protein